VVQVLIDPFLAAQLSNAVVATQAARCGSSLQRNDAGVRLCEYPGLSFQRSPVCACSLVSSLLLSGATMSQQSSLTQSAHSVRQVGLHPWHKPPPQTSSICGPMRTASCWTSAGQGSQPTTRPSVVPFFRWNALFAARREKGNHYVHIVTRFFSIHHTIAGKAYVACLVPPPTAKPPHRFEACRQQLSIGARRTKSEPMKLPSGQKNSASWSRRQFFCGLYLQTRVLDEPFQSIDGPPPVVIWTRVVFV